MKQKIKDMPVRTKFKLGAHVCMRLASIDHLKITISKYVPIINFTWGEAGFWPGDDEGEIIGSFDMDGNCDE